jgi:hypothetical protein
VWKLWELRQPDFLLRLLHRHQCLAEGRPAPTIQVLRDVRFLFFLLFFFFQ